MPSTPPPPGDVEDLFAPPGPPPPPAAVLGRASEARSRLLAWYDDHHRVLPWRRNFRSVSRPPPRLDESAESASDLASGRAFWRGVERTGAYSNVPADQYAYGVWVSEIMSQQTQIERVATYWTKWMTRWPVASALAEATVEEVNEMWAGLGYYRRARFLLDGAKHVRDELGGAFPTNAEALGRVPGVGPYTAAAVASIAGGEKIAAVDGNVIRVIARLAGVTNQGDASKPGSEAAKTTRRIARELLCEERPGDWNQAMMELGATACAPKNPKCDECPLSMHCAGLAREKKESREGEEDGHSPREGPSAAFRVADLPEKAKKPPRREETVATSIVEATREETEKITAPGEPLAEADGRNDAAAPAAPAAPVWVLLTRRPEGGLLGGLWEFPSRVLDEPPPRSDSADAADDALWRASSNAVSETVAALEVPGLRAAFARAEAEEEEPSADEKALLRVGETSHVFSHVRQTYVVHRRRARFPPGFDPAANPAGTSPGGVEWRWVRSDAIESAGLTSGVMKVWALWADKGGEEDKRKRARPNGKKGRTKNKRAAPPPAGESDVARLFKKAAGKRSAGEMA